MNQKINCTVFDCVHCDTKEKLCDLAKIEVTNNGGKGLEETTKCHSYDLKKK